MGSKIVRIAIAVVLAAVGTVVLVRYVESARDEAVAGEAVVTVYVVNAPIPKGTAGSQLGDSVHTEQVPEKVRSATAVTDLTAIKDLKTSVDLEPGEQLLTTRFVKAGDAARGDAPAGQGQVTIALDAEHALGGQIAKGDRVRFVNSAPGTAAGTKSAQDPDLENLLIVKVQGVPTPPTTSGETMDPLPSGSYFITFAGDDTVINKIVAAKAAGPVWLAAEPVNSKAANANGTPS